MEIGLDAGTSVGPYKNTMPFTGVIDEVRLYFAAADGEQIANRFQDGSEISSDAVLAVSFDDGSARDLSTSRNNGTLEGGKLVDGKFGKAIQFSAGDAKGNNNTKPGNSLVDPKWTQDVPIYVRGMVLAGPNLFIVGPPDIIDEEETFQKLTEKDEEVQKLLSAQDQALNGKDGSLLLSVNTDTGEIEQRLGLGHASRMGRIGWSKRQTVPVDTRWVGDLFWELMVQETPDEIRSVILVSLAMATVAAACNIPVFRYALERWQPDPCEVILFLPRELLLRSRRNCGTI